MFPFKADLNGSSPSITHKTQNIQLWRPRQMMIYITWSVPLPPAWVASCFCFGELNIPGFGKHRWKKHLEVCFWFDKNVDRNIMNGFCPKYFSIEMYNFEIFIVFPLHMLKVLRYCNVKYRALALAYLNIEILAPATDR